MTSMLGGAGWIDHTDPTSAAYSMPTQFLVVQRSFKTEQMGVVAKRCLRRNCGGGTHNVAMYCSHKDPLHRLA